MKEKPRTFRILYPDFQFFENFKVSFFSAYPKIKKDLKLTEEDNTVELRLAISSFL